MAALTRNLIYIALALTSTSASAASSLCTKDEKIIFSCKVKKSSKTVSVCASKSLNRNSGYLQYRFGTQKHVEFVYPTTKVASQERFYWEEKRIAQYGGIVELTFINQGYFYTISRYAVSEEYNDIPGGSHGGDVVVQKSGDSKFDRLTCVGYPHGEFYLTGIVRNADDLIGAK
jgi:hypothetical protein